MNIVLQHHFKHVCYDVNQLLDDVDTLSKFMRNLNKQSELKPLHFSPDKYKGDAFESLIEALIILSPVDKRINLIDYSPTEIDEKGVDGVGKSHDGSVHCVQIKYRSDVKKFLTEKEDHIAMFSAFAQAKYKAKFMTIFTTSAGLHYNLDDFDGTVKTFNYADLQKLVDNNDAFWTNYRTLLLTK
jgi:hypothetical protein